MRHSKNSQDKPFLENVRTALRQWHDVTVTESALRDLHCFQQVLRTRQTAGNVDERAAANALLAEAIHALAQTNEREAHFLQLRFEQQLPMTRLASELNIAQSNAYVVQQQSITQLTEVIAQMEAAATAEA